VAISYLDTSAAMKLLVSEPHSAALFRYVNENTAKHIVSSWLLHTELHCAAARHPQAISVNDVNEVLTRVLLVNVLKSDLLFACGLEKLRANDAIHLATAIRLGTDEFVAYDNELLDAAWRRGMQKVSPGTIP